MSPSSTQPAPESDTLSWMGTPVIELALCESEQLVLKPNVFYLFSVHPGCARCATLAEMGDPLAALRDLAGKEGV